MPKSKATSGYSTRFAAVAAPATPTSTNEIAEVINIQGPGVTTKTIDVSNMDSPNAVEEFVLGMTNPGQVQLTLNYLPGVTDTNATSQKALMAAQINRTLMNFYIKFPDLNASVWSFAGYVTHHEPDAPHDGKLGLKLTINITGVITYP